LSSFIRIGKFDFQYNFIQYTSKCQIFNCWTIIANGILVESGICKHNNFFVSYWIMSCYSYNIRCSLININLSIIMFCKPNMQAIQCGTCWNNSRRLFYFIPRRIITCFTNNIYLIRDKFIISSNTANTTVCHC
uniref:Envelope glycoprotein n=1 Tax=Brugia timori TaxID=42155 RepID=A0A0R3QD40_9BILA